MIGTSDDVHTKFAFLFRIKHILKPTVKAEYFPGQRIPDPDEKIGHPRQSHQSGKLLPHRHRVGNRSIFDDAESFFLFDSFLQRQVNGCRRENEVVRMGTDTLRKGSISGQDLREFLNCFLPQYITLSLRERFIHFSFDEGFSLHDLFRSTHFTLSRII